MSRRRRDDKKTQKAIIGIFIAAIMILSVAGLYFGQDNSGTTNAAEYNGIVFSQNSLGEFETEVEGITITSTYFPSFVENIETDQAAIDLLKSSTQVYTTSASNSTVKEGIALAQFQLASALQENGVTVTTGFTEATISNFGVITCDDATAITPVLLFKESNETKITIENNCIIAQGTTAQNILAARDRLVFGYYSII